MTSGGGLRLRHDELAGRQGQQGKKQEGGSHGETSAHGCRAFGHHVERSYRSPAYSPGARGATPCSLMSWAVVFGQVARLGLSAVMA